jgi:hypothetical protein
MADPASTRRILDESIRRMRRFISIQIQGVSQLVTDQVRHAYLHAIASCAADRMDALAEMVHAGATSPLRQFRLSEAFPPLRAERSTLRVGIYALAANPLHWGHLLVGLSALVLLKLDRVVFVIAGTDPRKPSMLPVEVRHRLACSLLDTFEPFLSYSPIALGTDVDGETNLGRLIDLNRSIPVHAFYIAGSDHFRRWDEKGGPDTIEKLEQVARKLPQEGVAHKSVSAVFIDRPGRGAAVGAIDTFLDVHLLPAMPMICSSSAARHALCTGEITEALTSVPYATFAAIRSLKLYDGGRECRESRSA